MVVFLHQPKGKQEEPNLQSPICPQPAKEQGVSSNTSFLPPAPPKAQHTTQAKDPSSCFTPWPRCL